jgi:hypothetical protein
VTPLIGKDPVAVIFSGEGTQSFLKEALSSFKTAFTEKGMTKGSHKLQGEFADLASTAMNALAPSHTSKKYPDLLLTGSPDLQDHMRMACTGFKLNEIASAVDNPLALGTLRLQVQGREFGLTAFSI